MGCLTQCEKIKIIEDGIRKVAEEKMIGQLDLKTSITNDLRLDSIEIMDLLIEVRSVVSSIYKKTETENMDSLLEFLFAESDDLLVESLCKFIDKI